MGIKKQKWSGKLTMKIGRELSLELLRSKLGFFLLYLFVYFRKEDF